MSTADARRYVTPDVTREATGALEAQRVIEGIQRDELTAEHACLAFCTMAACSTWKSACCRCFVLEAFKRAAQASR
jgi:hypothetical protein